MMSLKGCDVAVINGSKDDQNRTSSCTCPSHSDKQEDGWNVLDTLGALAYKEVKKNGQFVLPGFGKLVKQKRKSADGIQPQDAAEDQDSCQDRRQIPSRQGAKDAVLGVKK
jgi:DNA-binding protein HU-beta